MKQRILVVSHGHPDFSLGGAEIAAYNLFEAFKNNDDVEDTWFLARADREEVLRVKFINAETMNTCGNKVSLTGT